ncbi:GFA family protein [Phaeobacter sp. BS34]
MGTCHCSRCRKAGASTIVFVKREDLSWIEGKDQVALYQLSRASQIRQMFLQGLRQFAWGNPVRGGQFPDCRKCAG